MRKYARWTNHQMRLLRDIFETASREQIELQLAPHTWGSIRATANKQGLKRNRFRNWRAICAAHIMKSGIFEAQE
jgi:hypothetical protein